MKSNIRTQLHFLLLIFILVPTIAGGMVLVLTPFFLVFFLTRLPSLVGANVNIEEITVSFIDWAFGHDNLIRIRGDILELFYLWKDVEETPDNWSELTEIENASKTTERRLRNGEFVLATIGAILSIISTIHFSVKTLSVVVAVFLMLMSLSIIFRVVIVEILSFDSRLHELDDPERLVFMKGWNCGPMMGKGAILIAYLALLATKFEMSYLYGLDVLDWFVSYFSEDHRYYIEHPLSWIPSPSEFGQSQDGGGEHSMNEPNPAASERGAEEIEQR